MSHENNTFKSKAFFMNYHQQLKQFLVQARTDNLTYSHYKNTYPNS
jgi:hypothetical protein